MTISATTSHSWGDSEDGIYEAVASFYDDVMDRYYEKNGHYNEAHTVDVIESALQNVLQHFKTNY